MNFGLEFVDWIANIKKLEIFKLEMLRVEDKKTDNQRIHLKNVWQVDTSLEFNDCSLMYEPDFVKNIHEIIPSLETFILTKEFDNHFPMDIDYLVAWRPPCL